MGDRPLASYTGEAPYFFVSYGHADAELAHPEMRALQDAGFNLWYDEGIHVGAVWRQAIADALANAAGMLFIATRSSIESDNCLKELSFALDEGKPVLALKLDDSKLPNLLRLSLSDRQMLNRSDLRDVEYRARLVDAMSRIAAPNPVKPDSQRLPTQVPTIALQTLAASETGTAFWAEGLVDDLATLLGHRWFSISLTRNPERDPATLGRLLDVRYVLSGSVRREENRYRVNLKLTGGGTSTQVWSGRYDRTGDAIDASDAICRQAAIDVSEAVMNDDLKRVMKSDDTALDAWGLCLKAVPLGDWAEALRWARRAAVTYPSMYLVWLELANVLAMCDRLDEAREVVVRVRSTLPRFSFAHYEKGVRIAWRNRDRIVESQIVGLRKLEIG